MTELDKRQLALLVGIGATSFGFGVASGFYFAKEKYRQIADEEIAEMKQHYNAIHKVDTDPEELAQKYIIDEDTKAVNDILEKHNYITREEYEEEQDDVPPKDVVVEESVFGETPGSDLDDFDVEAEAENRDPEIPYVIHHDEYMENAHEFIQQTLTWYETDSVLADESDIPIEEIESHVGVDNLEKFGHGSQDRNVVYVRNERTEQDFEIIRSPGSFAKEVLGFDDSLKHSDGPKVRKMRAYHE